MRALICAFLFFLLPLTAFAGDKVLNIYTWTGWIPDSIVRKFEEETGIKVNIATYANNEIMYAKLRASKNAGYDIIIPSSYFIDRMSRQNMLEPLDRSKLPLWKNLNPAFLNPAYDPHSTYSVPYLWGATGIFYNDQYYKPSQVQSWSDFWNPQFINQLLLLDDVREVFSMALLSLGYPANDTNPEHIEKAFHRLQALMKNVKVFSSDTVASNIIDEDANVGMAWNGDAFKASQENPHVKFVYPKEGFMLWVDNLAIPKTAPHKDAAYQFINFTLRADNAKEIGITSHFNTANAAAQKLLPKDIQSNPIAYPPESVMHRGQFQTDVGEETLALFEKYWEELKMQ